MMKATLALMLCATACSVSADPTTPPTTPAAAPTITRFTGSFDAATGRISITTPTRTPDTVLPYGTGAGEVYFHTCSVSFARQGAGGTLTGVVQAVNSMVGIVPDLAVKITYVSDTGTTFSTTPLPGGVIDSTDTSCLYNTATWTFSQASTTNFTFAGEATGTVPTHAPFPDGGPSIVVFVGGDSISQNGVWGAPYPTLAEPALGPGVTVKNYAVPGTNCGQVQGAFDTDIRPQLPALLSAGVPVIYSVECGTNDLTPGGTHTPWQTAAYLRGIVEDAHDAGAKVMVMGIPANHDLLGANWTLFDGLEREVGEDFYGEVDPRLVAAVWDLPDGGYACDGGWMELGDCFHPNTMGQVAKAPPFEEGVVALMRDAGAIP